MGFGRFGGLLVIGGWAVLGVTGSIAAGGGMVGIGNGAIGGLGLALAWPCLAQGT
jgi:hypothetical protein